MGDDYGCHQERKRRFIYRLLSMADGKPVCQPDLVSRNNRPETMRAGSHNPSRGGSFDGIVLDELSLTSLAIFQLACKRSVSLATASSLSDLGHDVERSGPVGQLIGPEERL